MAAAGPQAGAAGAPRLGCLVPPGFAYVRPMGASAHYAGLVPMTREGGAGTSTPKGRSRDFENLWLADGITFPVPSRQEPHVHPHGERGPHRRRGVLT